MENIEGCGRGIPDFRFELVAGMPRVLVFALGYGPGWWRSARSFQEKGCLSSPVFFSLRILKVRLVPSALSARPMSSSVRKSSLKPENKRIKTSSVRTMTAKFVLDPPRVIPATPGLPSWGFGRQPGAGPG